MPKRIVKSELKALKAEELADQFGSGNGTILYPDKGHFEAISWENKEEPKSISLSSTAEPIIPTSTSIAPESANGNIVLLDGSIPILTIVKSKFIKAILELKKPLSDQGVVWSKPQRKHAIEIKYNISNSLCAEGDIKGLILWIDGKVITARNLPA